jgi:hypothetical protein
LRQWLAVLALTSAFLAMGCTASSAKVPAAPASARLRSDCSFFAPCNGVRQEWFANEAKDAELIAAYCSPPAPGRSRDCSGLEEAIANLHRLNLDYFSDLCQRLAGSSSEQMLVFVGKPDRDEVAPCGSDQCRVWIWYWSNGTQWANFTILLGMPASGTEWLVRRCNYCTTAECQNMPPTL